MRLLLAATWIALGVACMTRDQGPLKTEVVTYPDGAVVEFNGRPAGRAPTAVTLPQDTNGKLTERVSLRAVPNSAQTSLFTQTRILDPNDREERIPNRILIDMTQRDPHATNAPAAAHLAQAEPAARTNRLIRARQTDRGKPTQPVGIDRWNPGIY